MDFLTGFPYWGILIIILINALIVSRMDVSLEEETDDDQ
jgi:hypothetical protein|tara:strand:- start:509 stop:625 length:117 start_codon:yes stop_codon:yes gene_type:complete